MTRKSNADQSTDLADLQQRCSVYERVFGEVDHYIELIAAQEDEVATASEKMAAAKATYEKRRDEHAEAREARDGTKHALFKFLQPGVGEILPLFDRMEPADAKKHGKHADEWRKEPIAALRLSLTAATMLLAVEIMFVGQLQDRMQAEPETWWQKIDGLGEAVAAAIADKLTEFIGERTKK